MTESKALYTSGYDMTERLHNDLSLLYYCKLAREYNGIEWFGHAI